MKYPANLDTADDAVLYKLVGDAWILGLQPHPNQPYLLDSLEIGRREFDGIFKALLIDVLQPTRSAVVASLIAMNNRGKSTWKLPVAVVAALAARRGLMDRSGPPPVRTSSARSTTTN